LRKILLQLGFEPSDYPEQTSSPIRPRWFNRARAFLCA